MSSNCFYLDPIVEEKMFRLKTTQYKLNILHLRLYQKEFVLIQILNTCSLHFHFRDILMNPNLFASHIFCLNETNIQNTSMYKKTHNVISNNF